MSSSLASTVSYETEELYSGAMVVRIWEGEERIFAKASTSDEVRFANTSERATVARWRSGVMLACRG